MLQDTGNDFNVVKKTQHQNMTDFDVISKSESFIVINLNRFKYYLGGPSVKDRFLMNPFVLDAFDKKITELRMSHTTLHSNTTVYPRQAHDFIVVINSNVDVCILVPDFIYLKQTQASKGIIVCEKLEAYRFKINEGATSSTWEYQVLKS